MFVLVDNTRVHGRGDDLIAVTAPSFRRNGFSEAHMANVTQVPTLAPPRSNVVGGLRLAFAVTALLITGCAEQASPVSPSSNGSTAQFDHDLVGQPSVRRLSISSARGLGGARTHSVSSGYYLLVARHSGKCLDVNGASLADLASVIQWDCHEGDNQQWSVEPAGDGYPTFARDTAAKGSTFPERR